MSKSKKTAKKSSKSQAIPLHRSLMLRKEYIPVVIVTSLVLFALVQTVVQAATLRYESPEDLHVSSVLGDDDEDKKLEEQQKEEQKKQEEQQKEEEKRQEEQKKETEKNSTQSELRISNSGKSTKNSVKIENGKVEVEQRSSDGRELKTKVEDDGTTKIEVKENGLKVTYKIVNGVVEKVVEDEDGNEVELENESADDVESEAEDTLKEKGIEISTGSGRPTFTKNRVAARTNFPLTIDPVTNQLFVTTPKGTKAVAVLPDEAVAAMLANNVLTTIDKGNEDGDIATDEASLDTTVDLQVVDGEPVYEVKGTREYKMFAFLPVKSDVTALVSAETGLLVGTKKSFLTNLVDLLSP